MIRILSVTLGALLSVMSGAGAAVAADSAAAPPSIVDQVGRVRTWTGTVSVAEVGSIDGKDSNASGRVASTLSVDHRCSVQVILTAGPDDTAPLSRWDGDEQISCSIDDQGSGDVWDLTGRHAGHFTGRTSGADTVPTAVMLTVDPEAGTYSLDPGAPYIDTTAQSDDNGYASSSTGSTGVYTQWRQMLIEDQPLGSLALSGTITDETPYLPMFGMPTGPAIPEVITWDLSPLGWLPPDGCDDPGPSTSDTPGTPVPIMQDPSVRSGLRGERPEALRQAIAAALTSAGHPAEASMVNVQGIDDPRSGLLTFQVRLGQGAKPLPTLDCIGRAIDAGQVSERSVEGADQMLIGSLQTTDDETRIGARVVTTDTGEVSSGASGTSSGTDAAAMSRAAEAAVAGLAAGSAR